MEDLEQAIRRAREAVEATPNYHPNRAACLNSLGNVLGWRYERTGAMEDLEQALLPVEKAVEATPHDHPNRAGRLSNLGNWLARKFKRTGAMEDLEQAILRTEEAVEATPHDHPNRAASLYSLGRMLAWRDDLDRAVMVYKDALNCQNAPPSIRIHSAMKAARILASLSKWEESSILLEDAVHILPTVTPRSLRHTDQQHMVQKYCGLAADAASTSLLAGRRAHSALQLLELGRGIIFGLLLDTRIDISLLKRHHPQTAREFEFLRNELDSATGNAATDNNYGSWANRRREAEKRFNDLVIDIRNLPELHDFLLPPTMDELMTAAAPGPIAVINLSRYRCDAFVIEAHRIQVVPLPNLSLESVEQRIPQIKLGLCTPSILEWLWDVVAGPILEALSFHPRHDGRWPHVWWIPCGALNLFPLHAAGYHFDGSNRTVLDTAMSSYSSSIKTLIRGRQRSGLGYVGSTSRDAVLVSMDSTPGLPKLPFAREEVMVLENFCRSLQLQPVRPPQCKISVLASLRSCRLFHFAGHGRPDPVDPSRSCLLLEDWQIDPLTVGDLRDSKLQDNRPFLAYLSACSTSANMAKQLADEGIHLVGAFQLAGFKHVIGSLWEVLDSCCVDLARVVYETIRDEGMTDQAVCVGLHKAVRALRDRDVRIRVEKGVKPYESSFGQTEYTDPLYWAPFIHHGI
jgi:tetratricopeptide (TPR) repeat protein